MNHLKLVSFDFVSQIVVPKWRNLMDGDGVAEIEAAEFRVRNAVAGNGHAIKVVFETLARQSQQKRAIFGPFIFAGASGTGKTTLCKSLVSNSDPSFYLEFDLGACSSSHDGASIFGAPPGFLGHEEKASRFAESMAALNKALNAYAGPAEGMPLPVLCFDNADEAHPKVLAALKRLITTGTLQTHAGTEVRLKRCVIIMTMNRVKEAFTSLRWRELATIGPDLKRIVGNLKSENGAPLLKQELVESSTIVPFFEPSPTAITAFLSARFGREIALACGIPNKQTGRVRLAPSVMSDLWADAKIEPTFSASHIIEAIADEWDRRSDDIIQRARRAKETFQNAPPNRHAYFVHTTQASGAIEFPLVAFKDVQWSLDGSLPIPYVERIYGNTSVARGDYWDISDDFGSRLNDVISGQTPLVTAVVRKMQSRLFEKGAKPLISFMVTGPTGTGKTELGKSIAALSGHPLLFCECNTWQTEDAVFEGIFGNSETSVATRLRENPASVIVFDEVDKAHRKFWDYYMTAGDTGMIVDKWSGISISLRHAVIEMTSNYMADRLEGLAAQAEEKGIEEMDPLIRKALSTCAAINPACLERLDMVGLMMPLSGPNAHPIWNKFVQEKLLNMDVEVNHIADDIAPYLENRHLHKGGAPGARARLRTCDDLITSWATGCSDDFEIVENELRLSEAGRERHESNPTPHSERQRLWTVTEEKISRLKSAYRGNDALVDSVISLIKQEGMKVKPRGPVGVILAVGPTGSGKSYLGKAISEAFGKGPAVEIQCAQCGDAHSVAPFLFSAPAGYVGSESGGQLTNPVMTRKDRVFIFDEIDRAHPSLLDKVLNVLDEGTATDMGTQMPADLKQSLFVLTSNLAADELESMMKSMEGTSIDEQEAAARRIIAKTGRISAPMLARIQRVFAVTYRQSSDGFDTVRAAILSVLNEYDRADILVDDKVVRMFADECRAKSLRDVRSITRLVQAALAPALLGERDSQFVLRGSRIELLSTNREDSFNSLIKQPELALVQVS